MKAQGLRGNKNQCAGCLELFNSNHPFDMHRVGDFGVLEGPDRRRCMTQEEMTEAGMLVNSLGYWISEKHLRFSEAQIDD